MEFNPILSQSHETVAAKYERTDVQSKSTAYQSEADLESAFIALLQSQGYEYIAIHNEDDLIGNLRKQLERLNKRSFSSSEWRRLMDTEICKAGDGILEKSRRLQDGGDGFSGGLVSLTLDDDSSANIRLIDKQDIHANRLQILNQYETDAGRRVNRYDVTILCNGFPVVHIELKRRGEALKTAYNQIDRYQRDSFWSGCGLYEYVQIFVISNGTQTKYYANTVRNEVVKRKQGFEFTSWWADAQNSRIPDLIDFTKTFFGKSVLLNILTKYCVLGTDDVMRVMRPYQIAACESIIGKVQWDMDNNITGCLDAGGYIWHTTGSGKTLTSFKCARLLSKMKGIDKVLFVVDRKDLDAQTVREYDKFEKGAADSSSSTKQLEKRLMDDSSRIIVTTIQKLGRLLKRSANLAVYGQHVAFIFDECHRSQFGEMHDAIVKKFKKYYLFGFTGTPIFSVNTDFKASALTRKGADGKRQLVNKKPVLKTTMQAFGQQLHSYTIVDAINDGNVLPFRVDYLSTVDKVDNVMEEQVEGIDDKRALHDIRRIENICRYIAGNYNRKTNSGAYNSILCCDDIPAARLYYQTMKVLQKNGEFKYRKDNGAEHDLKFAVIFSYAANGELYDGAMDDEDMSADTLPQSDRDFLEDAISDYNKLFPGNETSFDTGSGFAGYYLDVCRQLKNGNLDIVIVVNMLLTGFDAQKLGCLWVDKNLRAHGLLQAFSRTNRIYDRQKSYGNIVCFRSLQQQVDDAVALFGDKQAGGVVTLKSYDEYYNGYRDEGLQEDVKGYKQIVEEFQQEYSLDKLAKGLSPQEEKDFVGRFGTILSLRNVLRSFDEFEGNELFTELDFQDYTSHYLDVYDEVTRHEASGRVSVNADLVFEIQLVDQIDINVDYILMLVEKYADTNCKDAEILTKIHKTVDSTPQLRSKRALIDAFLEQVNGVDTDTHDMPDWNLFVTQAAVSELKDIIVDENLKCNETFEFMRDALKSGSVKRYGLGLNAILPKMSRRDGSRDIKKNIVHEKLCDWFDKYHDAIGVTGLYDVNGGNQNAL